MKIRELSPVPRSTRIVAGILLATFTASTMATPMAGESNDGKTKTPIKHVIVIVGENRSFDHLFATYQPRAGQTVRNLLSEGIVKADGTPGQNFAKAAQFTAHDRVAYSVSPGDKAPYNALPPVMTGGAPQAASDTNPPPFATLAAAELAEKWIESTDYDMLLTGATGLPDPSVDSRVLQVHSLPNGPYQLTPGVAYDDYAGSPVHRFYQMWQQSDCNVKHATTTKPSGCLNDLYPWVETSVGAGTNGKPQPKPFTDQTTDEGAISMGFYNVQQGDIPYLTQLAKQYAMSDNYHQGVMGGTGANSVEIGTGDPVWYSDGKGNASVPPQNQIENPDPRWGTNNWYKQDGYSGGTYSNCSDSNQPGVSAVERYLRSLPSHPKPNCEAGHYYLLNNYSPGYLGDGSVNKGEFVIPPSSQRNIGDELLEKNISWKYYGEHWNLYVAGQPNAYCDICNPFQYSTHIMTDPKIRNAHIQDLSNLYDDFAKGTLPAVSFVKPDGLVDGHPASSKFGLYESFVHRLLDGLQAHPELSASTAVFITVDEAGGYWDSGYIQPVDFFGDGPRIPMIVVSPFSKGGKIDHTYNDHVSILKFIEHNWGISPVTGRSRDNLPNPVTDPSNPYVPTNSPAIGDLFGLFNFSGK